MPTIVTHAAVPLCLGLGLGQKYIPVPLLFAGIGIAMLPDADVLSFKLGVEYANIFGHRGFTHSLLFAFTLPFLLLLFKPMFKVSYLRIWTFLFICLLSHSVLDAFTTGGYGVGWLWPWSEERFFAPVQVIKVAPFALKKYLMPEGIAVMMSELRWVWLPGIFFAFFLRTLSIISFRCQPQTAQNSQQEKFPEKNF